MNELRQKWDAVINYLAFNQPESYKNQLADRLEAQEKQCKHDRPCMQKFFLKIQEELK